jgi:Zn-dependent protease with chaperone function
MTRDNSRTIAFLRQYFYPSLLIFALPVFALWFFHHAEATYDGRFLTSIESSVVEDRQIGEEERARLLRFFRENPASRAVISDDPAQQGLKNLIPDAYQRDYAIFRWMRRLALACVALGVAMFVVVGISLLLSRRSQLAQYYSLVVGWHALRAFATVEVIAQACLGFALAYWILGLSLGVVFGQLLAIAAAMAAASVVPVLFAIFRRVKTSFAVEGQLVARDSAWQLWDDVARLSAVIGTAAPDNIITGNDDNFFVTEQALAINDMLLRGRTLYVSLSLLRVLRGREAEAVMLHELAHFSGQDTVYSKCITPLLMRFESYLEGLSQGAFGLPALYSMQFFWALYQLSLRSRSRQREFRADGIAAEHTTGNVMAGALLRISAYSQYRQTVEAELLSAPTAHASANISERIEQGFQDFVARVVAQRDVDELTTTHPFDSHPPLGQRLDALGINASPESMQSLLDEPGEASWYAKIDRAEELEKAMWAVYEAQFQQRHASLLAYQYLPSTDEERAVVERGFPPVSLVAGDGQTVTFNYAEIRFAGWETPVAYGEIRELQSAREWGKPFLNIVIEREGFHTLPVPLGKTQAEQLELIGNLQRYYQRHLAAVAHNEQREVTTRQEAESEANFDFRREKKGD